MCLVLRAVLIVVKEIGTAWPSLLLRMLSFAAAFLVVVILVSFLLLRMLSFATAFPVAVIALLATDGKPRRGPFRQA